MAASVKAKHKPGRTYDVFLSFRGEDTRLNFNGHLYKALKRYGIHTFNDGEELGRGKTISLSLMTAIDESRFAVVILSKNYASSSWCLDELVRIIECADEFGQIVFPVFYHVDPSHVRNQTHSFKTAFDSHEIRYRMEKNKVNRWKTALQRVGSLSGFVLGDRDESEFIEDIVRDVSDRLFSESSSDGDKLVGIGYHMERMNSLLCTDSNETLMLGIWGMGGIGKTTISRALYDRFSRHYEGRCFFENVKEMFRKDDPTSLRKELLSRTLMDVNITKHCFDGGTDVVKKRLSRKAVFIVLDDVDDLGQLEALADKHDWFGPGSRIIITTRDKHLLVTHGVNHVYEVGNLENREAFQLFQQYAFKKDNPTDDYLDLSYQFISYAKGLPLALRILGAFLHKKSIAEWKSELSKLHKIPNPKIVDVLRISYDRLDDHQKNIFLDISCFFKGEESDFVTNIFKSCGFFPETGIRVLVDMALITISDNKFWIHDLLQEVGWEVVRQESTKDPGKRSRLCVPEDVNRVFKNNTGTEVVEGIFFDMSSTDELRLNSDVFTRMHNLRLLKIYSSEHNKGHEVQYRVHFPRGLNFLSEELRYLSWHRYPLKYFPSDFHPRYLVELDMCYSNIKKLWEGALHLTYLKRIDLGHCRYLVDIADLSHAENLEFVNLEGCTSLQKVHSSFKHLKRLVILNLDGCSNLKSPPETAELESLEDLNLSGCTSIKKSPEVPKNLKQLNLEWTSVEKLHASFMFAHTLSSVSLKNCKFIQTLPPGFCSMKSLKYLTLSGCSKLANLPENFGNLSSLVNLQAEYIAIKTLPSSIRHLRKLTLLSLRGCKGEESTGLILPPLQGLSSLKTLDLRYCNMSELPEGLGSLSCLKFLELGGNSFECISESIMELPCLFSLGLAECKRLRSIPRLWSNIEKLDAHNCTSLESVSNPFRDTHLIECPSDKSTSFIFTNCFNLNQNAPNIIVAHALQKIELAANASLKLWNQGVPTNSIRICIPGEEIPMSFAHKSSGSSVHFQLNPQPDSMFIGLLVCVVVSCGIACFDDFTLRYECRHTTLDRLLDFSDLGFFDGLCDSKEERRLVNSDHVFLGYTHLVSCVVKADMYTGSNIEFCIMSCRGSSNSSGCCKVKKCGVRPFYQWDID